MFKISFVTTEVLLENINSLLPQNFQGLETYWGLASTEIFYLSNFENPVVLIAPANNTDASDYGAHTVCAVMTADFLAFSKSEGNDLSTPLPHYDFPGLQPGDKWCLCAQRWLDAFHNGCAPMVYLEATNEKTLEIIPIDILIQYAFKPQLV